MRNFRFKNAAIMGVCNSSKKNAPSRKGQIKYDRSMYYFGVFANCVNVSISVGTKYQTIAKIERDPVNPYATSKPWNGLMFAYDWDQFTGYLYQEVDQQGEIQWVDAEYDDQLTEEIIEDENKQTETKTETTMEGLIKITEQDGKQLVSARELHEFLVKDAKGGQKGEEFAHWVKRMIEYLSANENEDYVTLEFDYLGNPIAKFSKSDNQQVRVHKRDYFMTIEMAKEVSMIQNNDKGKQARQYFIACEKKLQEVALQQFKVPTSFREALLLAAEQQEQIEKQQLRIEEMKPKEEFYHAVGDSKDAVSIGDVAKILGYKNIGRNSLFGILRINKVIGNDNLPYQKYINAGYFNIVVSTFNDGVNNRTSKQTYVYPKGLEFIRKVLEKSISK